MRPSGPITAAALNSAPPSRSVNPATMCMPWRAAASHQAVTVGPSLGSAAAKASGRDWNM
jgi:hypothetical protein